MEKVTTLLESLPKFKNNKHQQLALHMAGVAVASSLLYTSYKLIAGSNKQHFKKIPEPGSSYPYVGHIYSFGDLPGTTVAKWHAELGHIIKIRMGVQTWIIIDDPDLTHKVFVRNGIDSSHRPSSVFKSKHFSMNERGMAFAQPGPGLNKNRSAALAVLSSKMTEKKYMDLIVKESIDFATRLIESTESDGSVDPFKLAELFSLNIIFNTCFGRRFDNVKDPEFIKLATMVEDSMKNLGLEQDMGHFLPIFSVFEFLSNAQVKKRNFMKNYCFPIYRKLCEEALTRDGPNVIKSLDEDGFDFSVEDKMVFTLDLITAGTDTIAVALYGIFAQMCNYPEIQKNVASEIDEFVNANGHIPTFSERKKVPYCVSVIKECLRMKNTLTLGLPHYANKDIEVDGYLIPKDSTLLVSMKSLNRSPKFYSDPNTFKPERFINNLKTMQSAASGKHQERDHFNFGFGRQAKKRICPGIALADAELFCAFVQVFTRVSIEPVDGKMPDLDSEVNGGITVVPGSYNVKFVRRDPMVAEKDHSLL